MQLTSKLTAIAVVLVIIIVVFGRSLFTDVIWLGFTLIGVLAMLILHGTELADRLSNRFLRILPRLLLGISSLAAGLFVSVALFGAARRGELDERSAFYGIGVLFIAGLFLYVGFSWLRQALEHIGR